MAGTVAGDPTVDLLLDLVHDIVRISGECHKAAGDPFRKDCTDLVRKVSLLTHVLEEIRDSAASPDNSWCSDLAAALQATKRLLSAASFEGEPKRIAFQFQCVTWKLEKALVRLPYDQFDISEEVREQVELVRAQLKRAADKYGPMNSNLLSRAMSQPSLKELDLTPPARAIGNLHIHNIRNVDHEVSAAVSRIPKPVASRSRTASHLIEVPTSSSAASEVCSPDGEKNVQSLSDQEVNSSEETRKSEAVPVPDDFLCPIALEIMRNPVIVATGQTYERSYIQRWIDNGNLTCPKTQQKLQNLTLTPNYVLRSLISHWCLTHDVEQPSGIVNGKMKNTDGSFRDISCKIATIEALVQKLSSRAIEEIRTAVTELRSLSKRSTDNRILIAEAGAIPPLVHLLTSEDVLIQENAVTSILNLSIYENNKGLIMLSGAVPSIVQVLRAGSVEARENAAATLFSLSLGDENKIIIGASGAIPALVDLLQIGSSRGKKDAATALYNICIYQGNKGRAARAGIISALLKMLTDSSHCMVDEALTILSVLASCQEAKAAMVKGCTIPVLIDLLRAGLPRNKEYAAAILLSLCKRDSDNLGCISRLGALIPLTELAKSGTERAKRKAASLLELLDRLHKQ